MTRSLYSPRARKAVGEWVRATGVWAVERNCACGQPARWRSAKDDAVQCDACRARDQQVIGRKTQDVAAARKRAK